MKRVVLMGVAALAGVSLAGEAHLAVAAKGGVFTESETPVVTLEGATGGWGWTLLDWRCAKVREGAFPADGRQAFADLPRGYYYVQAKNAVTNLREATFCRVVDPAKRAFPKDSFYGIDAALSWVCSPGCYAVNWYGEDSYAACLDLMRKAGLVHVRERLSWSEVSKAPGAYNWGRYARNAKLARERGLVVSGMFHDAAPYADVVRKAPRDLAAVYRFCRDAANALGDAVGCWEFWNEPDIGFFPMPVWDYMSAQKAAFLGFRSARPQTPVLNGAVCTGSFSTYESALFENDLARYSDVFNFHTYGDLAAYPGLTKRLHACLERAGLGDRAAYLTEFGTNLEGHSLADGLMPGQKAHSHAQEMVLAEVYAKATTALQMLGVRRSYWFVFGPYNERNGAKDWGVQRRDGSVKPIYLAMATVTEHLADAKIEGELNVGDGVRAFVFRRADGSQILVAWARTPCDGVMGNSEAPTKSVGKSYDRAFSVPARDGAYVAADWCGVKSTVRAKGGRLNLTASRHASFVDGLRGLRPDIPARPAGRVETVRSRDGEDLSVVMRAEFATNDFTVAAGKTAVEMPGERGKMKLVVWNLSDEPKTGSLKAEGVALEGLPPAVTLPPMGSVALDATLVYTNADAPVVSATFTGTFNGKRTSRLAVRVRSEKRFNDLCVATPLAAQGVAYWQRNDSASRTTISWDDREKAVRFDCAWDDPRVDRWFYPFHMFKTRDESFDDAVAFEFEVKMTSNKTENDVACSLLMFLGGQEGNQSYLAPNGNWEKRKVLLADLMGRPGHNGHSGFRIGCNPRGTRMTYWIRNLRVYRQRARPATTTYAPETASRETRFANPPASCRILPIRHGWTHDAARAAAEIEAIKADGFGGFVCNVNFDTNYLANAASWQTLRRVIGKAHALGMRLWVYDEKGYPSCTAGGLTLEGHPEWQARAYLVAVTNDARGALRVTGVRDAYIREGTHVSVSVSHYKYAYPNLLMREPTDRFIALTHEAYRRELGPALKYFDSTFTDEPSLMTLWMRPMPELCLPISDELLAAYAAKFGHPLKDDIPALVTGEPVGRTAAIRHRYWTMVAERVARNYTGRLTEWATANGILSGGHLLAEESAVAHVALYGDFFRVLRGLSAPSCDMLTSIPEQVTPLTPLLVGSAGELNGSRRVMSESSDHCQQWRRPNDTRPRVQVTARQIVGSINRQIWGGVNTFTSYYRWGAFSSAERVAINEEIGRALTLASEGRSAAEVAVLYPADTLMTGYEPKKRGGGGELAQRTATLLNTAIAQLFTAGRPLLLVDAATLASAEVNDGALVSGPLCWRTVVLPNAETLPVGAARKLAALQAAGGQVIALGSPAVNSQRAFPDAEVTRLAANWTRVPDALGGCLADILARRHEPAVRVTRGARDAVRIAHRRTAKDGDVFFVLNDTDCTWAGAVRLADGGAARVWNPRVGLSHEAAGEIPLELPPYAAVVLTTPRAVEGRMRPGATPTIRLGSEPLAPTFTRTLGKGAHVRGTFAPTKDGFARVETTLAKGGVDTFAFLNHAFDQSPFKPGAKGVSCTVRVPKANPGGARLGIFLTTKDRANYYAQTAVSLGKAGSYDVSCLFSEFFRHGGRGATTLKVEDIRSINIGYGGYYGYENEPIAFEVSAPRATVLEEAR